MKKIIIIYSQDGCPYCSELKEGLTELNLPYHVKDIGECEEEWKLVSSLTENEYVPTACVFNKEDGGDSVFLAPDRDWQDVSECLDKIKNLI